MKSKIERISSKIDLMVLGLVLERPMHGYEINQIIGSDDMQSWLDISRTSVYYALSRLKKQGLITEVVEKQYNKPDRSIYRITEPGRELFFDSLGRALAEQEKVFLEYNIGLFFINKLAKEKALDVIERRKRFLKKWRTVLNEQLKNANNGDGHIPTLRAVVDHTLSFAEHEISWLDAFTEDVSGSAIEPGAISVFSLNGNLKDAQLADIIRIIASGERTGTLRLTHGLDTIAITFEEGNVRYVTGSSGLLEERLDPASADTKTLPEGILEPFNWPEGNFVFMPDYILDEGIALEVESCQLIFAGCRKVDDWSRIRRVIPSSDTIYKLCEGCNKSLEKIKLNSEEETVLKQVNGIRSIERLAQVTSMSMFDISRVLYTFVICGLVITTGKDKGELFDFLKLFSDALFERLVAVKAEKIAGEIEEELNTLAGERKMPFSLHNYKLVDSSVISYDFKEFVVLTKEFYAAQVKAVRSKLGGRFTEHVLESIIGQLTPEMHDVYSRHGFNNLIDSKLRGN